MRVKRTSRQRQFEPPPTLLAPSDPASVRWNMQELQLAIARRAYELFNARRREHGHDWEDWFRAEAELLRPVSFSISETEDQISVRANVLGFEPDDLEVSIEPRRITILGNKETGSAPAEAEQKENFGSYPAHLLKVVELETDVTPAMSVVELDAGVLKFELQKASKCSVKIAAVA